MPSYAHYYSLSEVLTERLRVYLDRMEERARDFGAEAVPTAAELRSADPESLPGFRAEVSRPIMFLHTKAERAVGLYFAPFEEVADAALTPEEHDALRGVCETARSMVEDFHDRLERVVDDVFADGRVGQAEREWEKAVGDWHLAQSTITCSQCGSLLVLPELYHVAVNVTCQGCGSRVTFQPSASMRAAPDRAVEIAETQVAEERQGYEEQAAQETAPGMELVCYTYYRLAWFRRLSAMLPFYARTRKDDVLGEVCSRFHLEGGPSAEHPRGARYAEVAYANIMGSFGDFAAALRQQGLAEHLDLLLTVVRTIMRPEDALAQSVLDGTYSEAAYLQHVGAALQAPQAHPR